MTADNCAVEVMEIAATPQLDRIVVYWHNYGPGSGRVTATCYGSAWTAYFGAMGGDSIQEFFRRADIGYLVTKLGITQWLKRTKGHEMYLAKIVEAIKIALAANG